MSQTPSQTQLTAAAPRSDGSRLLGRIAPWVIVAAAAAAYATSFTGAFALDDMVKIVANPNVHTFQWPPELIRDKALGRTRPLVLLTLQANYAISGERVWSYHLFNLLVHVTAALTLFGLLRRTLDAPRLRGRVAQATSIAAGVALIWAVHPLTTQAVTYIIQRCESLAGLWLLLALYTLARGNELIERPAAGNDVLPGHWYALSVLATVAGILSKELVVTAGVLILAYDWLFWARSAGDLLRRRWVYYLALAATPLIYVALIRGVTRVPEDLWSAYFQKLTPWEYLLTQTEVVAHYLRLAIWPYPQCFDYAWPKAESLSQVALPGLVVLGLLAATLVLLVRRSPWAYLGVWFFVILAPTSSVVPIFDVAVEHRMYLPLISVVTLVVLAIAGVVGRVWPARSVQTTAAVCLGLALVLGAMTARRNLDYRDRVALWRSVVEVRPQNPRAQYNLGMALANMKRPDEAIAAYEAALKVLPDFEHVRFDLGTLLLSLGRADEAEPHLRAALARYPRTWLVYLHLGLACEQLGRDDEALDNYTRAVDGNTDSFDAQTQLGIMLARCGRIEEAIPHLQRAVDLQPGSAIAQQNLRTALLARDRKPGGR